MWWRDCLRSGAALQGAGRRVYASTQNGAAPGDSAAWALMQLVEAAAVPVPKAVAPRPTWPGSQGLQDGEEFRRAQPEAAEAEPRPHPRAPQGQAPAAYRRTPGPARPGATRRLAKRVPRQVLRYSGGRDDIVFDADAAEGPKLLDHLPVDVRTSRVGVRRSQQANRSDRFPAPPSPPPRLEHAREPQVRMTLGPLPLAALIVAHDAADVVHLRAPAE